jgi:protein-disulfide isomerase
MRPLNRTVNEARVSDITPGDGRLSKNERREAAREKARLLREEQKKKDRRTRFILQGSIILALLAIVAIVAVVLVNSVGPSGPGPKNMASDGIQLTQGAIATPTTALKAGEDPIPNVRDEAAGTLDIQMYVDYLCPICGDFEKTNGDYITSLLDNGKTTVEIHPIAILDRLSQGSKYSTRAANAAACVANYSPNQFYDFHNLLFASQPAENTTGLTDDQLIDLTTQAAVESPDQVATCIKDVQFKKWVADAQARALNGPIPNSNVDKVKGTPTVIVNGLKYEGSVSDLASFQAFVIQAAGSDFNQNSTPTPTPTATPAG